MGTTYMQKEQGHTIVEATIIYPVTILVFFVLLYAALFVCQRANLQANLEDALIYYKNADSDTYVTAGRELSFSTDGNIIAAAGNTYEEPQKLDPYRSIFRSVGIGSVNSGNFSSFFRSAYRHMFFDDGSNITVTIKEQNFLIYKRLTATAEQTVRPAVNIAFVGASNSLTISSTATVVVVDGDSMIRDIDFAKGLVSDTRFGKAASKAVGKAVDFYNKLKEKLGI